MNDEETISLSDYVAKAEYRTERKWIIVGFQHPNESQSLIYKKCKLAETLLRYVQEGIDKGCNLFSIRGIDETYSILPDPMQKTLGEKTD
jgi:hypothetical protein